MAAKKPKKKLALPKKEAETPPEASTPPEKPQAGPKGKDAPEGTPEAQEAAGGFTEKKIRDEGWAIDVPFEVPDPGGADLRYSADGEAEKWEPEEGLTMGGVAWAELPPIKPEIAKRLGLAQEKEQGDDAAATGQGTGDGAPQSE